MLQGDPSTGPLEALFYQFVPVPDHIETAAMCTRLRTKILDMDGHLHWRLIEEFEDFTYDVFRMVHPKLEESDQFQYARRFFSDEVGDCDLSDYFGLKLRMMFESPQAMFDDRAFKA